MNGWIDITIDDQDQTQVMLVPGGMLVMHTVKSLTNARIAGEDAHYRPAMVFVPCDAASAKHWIAEQLEKAGAR